VIDLREVLGDREAWVVGGTVRDELLGRPVTDVDLAVTGDVEPAARAIAGAVAGPVFRLSETFGAWRVVEGDRVYDVSPLQGRTIEEDLARRDFTVNAMARPLDDADLIDPRGRRPTGTIRCGRSGWPASPPSSDSARTPALSV
jgi:poly(A) polymerase